ncbi:hypothetical protein L2E82_25922 [Cichorium intybus]|uniref:Uncharacterized protein n=1 Tax=Cichorium intybus TaxID=13427 RepID=A0ACB9E5J8_CICIN|nr:hypothetical protein L2E82_25922 [Cichorium intybus]
MAMVLTWMVIATVFSFSVAAPEEALISQIAFGSCANQTSPQSVELWLVDKAVLPIENSVGGSIHRNYGLLIRYRLHIVGEVQMIVNHCLLGLPGVRKEELNRVLSHPKYLDRTTNITCTVQFGKPTEQEETQVKQSYLDRTQVGCKL